MPTTNVVRSIALEYIEEPRLTFAHGQESIDPKLGLFAYGPFDLGAGIAKLRIGAVGAPEGLSLLRHWMNRLRRYIPATRSDSLQYLSFPGFQSVFGVPLSERPLAEITIPPTELQKRVRTSNQYERVHSVVGIYERVIKQYLSEEERPIDVWIVVIPDDVHLFCRPKSSVPVHDAHPSALSVTRQMSTRFLGQQRALFPDDEKQAEIYRYQPDFHNQLKARLLNSRAVIQIVRESTLLPFQLEHRRQRQTDLMVAWNISTTLYYKSGGKPWQLADMRDGVCYVGLVFKKDETDVTTRNVCCGAQLFMSSGDGVVFKVAKGNFQTGKDEYHLPRQVAENLVRVAVDSYKQSMNGKTPSEIFIHGKTRFSREEWEGFNEGCPKDCIAVCVQIRPSNRLKLFTRRRMPVLRGTALIEGDKESYLWTRGFIPQIGTYPGREVPNPLSVEIVQGHSQLSTVMRDILALTKVNFNSCLFGDGLPVTLRFADSVGEILTAAPIETGHPLPFKHYI